MPFLIRTIPANKSERPTYWLPGPKGYTRTSDMNDALGRTWNTRAEAVAYLQAYSKPGAQDEVIEV
jgi:hypothetical protein